MDQFAVGAIKSNISSKVSSMKASLNNSSSAIKWDDFNYPPLLHLIHYSSAELPDSFRNKVRCIHASFLILLLVLIINVVNVIVQVAQGGEGINIFYSILNIFIFGPLGMFVFYRGYKGMAADSYLLKFYKIAQAILVILYLVFSIIAAGAFNGWLRVKDLFGKDEYFPAVLSIIESALYEFNAILGIICIIAAHNYREGGSSSENNRT